MLWCARRAEISVGADAERLQSLHADAFSGIAPQVRPLPGAIELLAALAAAGVPHAIATSGRMETARLALDISAWVRVSR